MSKPQPKKNVNHLLSNVNPPTELPSFVTQTIAPAVENQSGKPLISQVATDVNQSSSAAFNPNEQQTIQPENQFIPPTFSAAIPPQPDQNVGDAAELNPQTPTSPLSKLSLNPNTVSAALDPITQGGANLFGWMKDAAASGGGLLSRVAEKAKNSVDTIVTTLDPQMREYIYSGGDLEVLVASDKDDKIRPIREAFQTIFGRATVTGFPAQPKTSAAQPVGYEFAQLSATERIQSVRDIAGPGGNLPIVAVENFLVEVQSNEWFDIGILLLSDLQNGIDLKTFTQLTPIPPTIITTLQTETGDIYERKEKGFSITIGSMMANNLKCHPSEWHHTYAGVHRSDLILSAAKALAFIYKQKLSNLATTE